MTWLKQILQTIQELTARCRSAVTRLAICLDRILQTTSGAVLVPIALTAILLGVLLAVCRCEGVL